jgi:hypothetical protein
MIRTIRPYSPPLVPSPTGKFRDDTDAVRNYMVKQFLPWQFNWLTDFANDFNTGPQGLGADIVSATAINFSAFAHRVTGTAAIATINVPPTIPFAGQLILISIGGFSLTTGGNIASAKSVTINTAVWLIWSQVDQLWFPNS